MTLSWTRRGRRGVETGHREKGSNGRVWKSYSLIHSRSYAQYMKMKLQTIHVVAGNRNLLPDYPGLDCLLVV